MEFDRVNNLSVNQFAGFTGWIIPSLSGIPHYILLVTPGLVNEGGVAFRFRTKREARNAAGLAGIVLDN